MKNKAKITVRIGRVWMPVFIMAILLIILLPVTLAIAADPMDNMPMAGAKETKAQGAQTNQPAQGTGWGTSQPWGMGSSMMGHGMMGRGGMMGWGMQPAGSMSPMMGCGMMGHGMMGHGAMGYGSPQAGQGNMSGMQMEQGKTTK